MLLGYSNPATASAPYPASLGWYSTAQCAASRYRSLLLPAPEYHLPVPANCHVNGTKFRCGMGDYWWLDSRVVSVLDSGAEGPRFKSQSRRCRVTVVGKLFTPIVLLFTKQQNW